MAFTRTVAAEKEKQAAYNRAYYLANKEACNARSKAWYEANKEAQSARDKARWAADLEQNRAAQRARYHSHEQVAKRLLDTYGLTPEDYDNMLEAQGGGCAICGRSPEEESRRLCVDHDHETGENRGILCNSCNVMLGGARDDPQALARGIDYLLGGAHGAQ